MSANRRKEQEKQEAEEERLRQERRKQRELEEKKASKDKGKGKMTDDTNTSSKQNKEAKRDVEKSSHQASTVEDKDSLNKVAMELQEAVQSALQESKVEGHTEAVYKAKLVDAIKCLATIFVQT